MHFPRAQFYSPSCVSSLPSKILRSNRTRRSVTSPSDDRLERARYRILRCVPLSFSRLRSGYARFRNATSFSLSARESQIIRPRDDSRADVGAVSSSCAEERRRAITVAVIVPRRPPPFRRQPKPDETSNRDCCDEEIRDIFLRWLSIAGRNDPK